MFISRVRSHEGNKHQITLEWVQKQFVTRVHTLFYFLHDKTNPQMTIKRRFLHIAPVSHSLGFQSADDITIDCWWRPNDQTIATRTGEQWYLTRQRLISFTAMFAAGRVRTYHRNAMKTIKLLFFIKNIYPVTKRRWKRCWCSTIPLPVSKISCILTFLS